MEAISQALANTNLMRYLPTVILPAIGDTLKMVLVSAILSIFFGIILGIILVMTADNGLSPHPIIHGILGKVTDVIRSFPMMILIVAIAPITRFFIGTKIGVQAAIFAITLGSTPFATRMTENSLNTVDPQLIKMAKSIGASKLQIIFKVMLVEALPTMISNFTIMMINMLNTSAMAGAVGAGGLGAVALTYGYQRFDYMIMYFIVIILIFLVMLIQGIGNKLYKLTK
ncbi:ABC transporter permease subunit [Faecalicatena contorta]|uniref:methionine ABC transporter permease n=1 Tax=Faecalicatena contorta TaxID=39482 RepID=UPI001F2B6CF8|nr:ABC transporter permease subunit [Faecalicatena contorta]MCF2680247.1 ABC transporter permease subunit [Faecalicatena contorta]